LLERLANWPSVAETADDRPALELILAHTALVLDIDRIVVLWGPEDTARWRYANWNRGDCTFGQIEADPDAPPVIEARASAKSFDPDSEGRTLVQTIAARFDIVVAAWAPLRAADLCGFLLIPGATPVSTEFESLTRIVASRIENEFEHFRLISKLTEAAAAAERVRLARILHDSLLQNLTATALQLKARAAGAPAPAQEAIEETVRLLAAEQQRVREFVSLASPPSGGDGPVSTLTAELDRK
jgi:signal transduction histidine kinase